MCTNGHSFIYVIVPACEMSAREFGQVVPNANETRQLRSTALSANTLKIKVIKLIMCSLCFLFKAKFTNYKTNGYIIRKSDAIAYCHQFIVPDDWSHFQCKFVAYTEAGSTSSKPKLSLVAGSLQVNIEKNMNYRPLKINEFYVYLAQFDFKW